MSNDEFLSNLMNDSQHGSLMQAFILQAIQQYAKAVAKADVQSLETNQISGECWKACANEALNAIEGKH